MKLPGHATVLGQAPGPLALASTGARAMLPLEPGPHRQLIAHLGKGEGAAPCRISLCLEGIRGTQDAAVLHVTVGPATGETSLLRRPPPAAPIALYGLRRASSRRESRPGAGLTHIVDVTAAVTQLPLARSLAADTLAVTIAPAAPLPEPVDLTIARLLLIWERF